MESGVGSNAILSYAERQGLILSKDSVGMLEKREDWRKILEEVSGEGIFFIDAAVLEKKIDRTKFSQVTPDVEVRKASFTAQAKDRAPDFRVMKEYDVTGQSNSEGKIDDFLRLFRSKYELLSGMLRMRHNLNPIPIKNLATSEDRKQVDVIGIVNKKWITKKGHTAFEIEDMEAKCIALVMEKEKAVMEKAERILEDNVVGIKGTKWGKDFIIIKEVYWPDLPMRPAKVIKEDVLIGSITDMHVGSKLFYEEQFGKLLDYLNGKNLSEKQQERVGKIQYIMCTGDNVAGVGVYPGQLDDLAIKDVYEQYAKFEELMLQIPDYIHIFVCTPAGTLIKTPCGFKPVEELKEGDAVYSYDETQKIVLLNKISSVLKRNAPKLLKLKFSGGMELTCTPEHPLFTYDGTDTVWKKAEELKEGALLPIPRAYEKVQLLKTIDILKNISTEVYVRSSQRVLAASSTNKFFSDIPQRTRFSYFSGEAPVPLSLLSKIGEPNLQLLQWPIQAKTHHGKYVTLPEYLPAEFFYVMGLVLSDGSFAQIKNRFPDGRIGQSYRTRIFNSNKNIIQSAKDCLDALGITPTEEFIELPGERIIKGRKVLFKKPIINLSFTNKFLGELLVSLGIAPGPKKKSSMGKISTYSWEYLKYFIAGLLDGDGTRNNKILQLTSSSQRFAKEIFLALQEHGFAPNISFASGMYRVSLHRNADIKRFFEEVPFQRILTTLPPININMSIGKLKALYGTPKNESEDFVLWRKLVKIDEISGDTVYNMEVEKVHTYIAMGIINHNCPGQHDAVRRAEPQPAIDKEFVPRLSKMRNFHFISSPSWVETEGIKNMIYHGPSVHDLISSVSFLDYSRPQEAMVELLKKRDLMPKYGGKNPYVPEGKDYMVIKEEPDIVWVGDMHHKGYANYRGTTVINGSTWEGLTEFEKKIGHVPTPCIFPTINLKNREIMETHFSKETVERSIEENKESK